jgi:hypothetical protein
MATWTLVPCLGDSGLRGEFNALSPDRDKRSDGSVGDAAHAGNESDHNPDETGSTHDEDSDSKNEVHAIDVDASGPWPNGMTMWKACDHIRAEHKAGRDNRIQTIIHTDPDGNSKIATNDNGYVWKPYSGSNPHREHAHFSARYDTGKLENDTRSFGLVEKWGDDMPTAQEIAAAVWSHSISSPSMGIENRPAQDWLKDAEQVSRELKPVHDLLKKMDAEDPTDEQAIIDGVLAGLAGAEGAADTIADAVVAALPADLATDVANQILAKQGQAMVDASGGEGGS